MDKINLKHYTGFCILERDKSWEAVCVALTGAKDDIPVIRVQNEKIPCPQNYVPCGSVEWCLKSLGKNIIPDYYPGWLSEHLHRKVWEEDKWPLEKKVFIKPADKYKRFDGFKTVGTYKKKKKPPFWCSEIVDFVNEWRYYISNGKVLTGEWYMGDEVNTPEAPKLNIKIPETFYGTLDFGITKQGNLSLVEAHHPFACGWYGKQHELYLQWLIDGWEYLQYKYTKIRRDKIFY